MKRKWLSCVLSAALLSSVLSVTPVSARGGVETSVSQADTAVVAGTADPAAADEAPAVEETAQVTALAAEEAADEPATVSADSGVAAVSDDSTAKSTGITAELPENVSLYQAIDTFDNYNSVTEAVEYGGDTNNARSASYAITCEEGGFTVSLTQPDENNSKALTITPTGKSNYKAVRFWLNTDYSPLQGSGIAIRYKAAQDSKLFLNLQTLAGDKAYLWDPTDQTTTFSATNGGYQWLLLPYNSFVPRSEYTDSNGNTVTDVVRWSEITRSNSNPLLLKLGKSPNNTTEISIDYIGFYTEGVVAETTYTVRANDLRSTSDARARNDHSDLYTISVKRGKASFTFKKQPTFTVAETTYNGFDTYMYFPISGADLNNASAITFTVKRPADMHMQSPSYFAALYPGTANDSDQLGKVVRPPVLLQNVTDQSAEYGGVTQSFNVPFSEFGNPTVDVNATYYLRINFNAIMSETYTGRTLEVWDIGVSHKSSETLETGTVTKTVAVSTKNGGTVTATVDGQDHARLMSASIEVAETTNIRLTAVAFADKKFNNWSKSDDNNFSDDRETITSSETIDVSYVAQFSDAFYTVTVNDKDNNTFYKTTVGYSDTITPIAPAYYEEGLSFQSWTISDSAKAETVEDNQTYKVLGDVTFTPVYEEITTGGNLSMVEIRVENGTINYNGGNYSSWSVCYNTLVTMTASTNEENKVFSHWKQGETIVGYEKTLTILAKVGGLYTAVYVDSETEKETPKSQLIVRSVKLGDAHGAELTLICEWHMPSDVVTALDNVTLTVACTDGKNNQTYTCNVTAYNGYYTLRIAFPGGIPADFTATVTLNVGGTSAADYTYSAQ